MKISISLTNTWLKNVHRSETPTDACHFGDLQIGRDTVRRRMDSSRGTGHFGCGVYFLSKESADKIISREAVHSKRPMEYIDLNGLKLLRPKDTQKAYELHDLLRNVCRLSETGNWPDIKAVDDREHPDHKLWFRIYLDSISFFRSRKFLEVVKLEIIREQKLPAWDIRSIQTRVIQRMGYQGIDVRHTDLDNTSYGSVIFATID